MCMCVIFFLHDTHTHTRMHAEKHNYSLFLFQLLGESIWLLLLLHSGHHSETQNGRFCCIMSRRYCVVWMYGWMYCMHVWAEDETQSLMIKTCLSHTLQQHNTDKMKAAKKKKEEKIPVFLLRRAPQRGCSTYSCGTRHHFSPLWKKKRRRKKKISASYE